MKKCDLLLWANCICYMILEKKHSSRKQFFVHLFSTQIMCSFTSYSRRIYNCLTVGMNTPLIILEYCHMTLFFALCLISLMRLVARCGRRSVRIWSKMFETSNWKFPIEIISQQTKPLHWIASLTVQGWILQAALVLSSDGAGLLKEACYQHWLTRYRCQFWACSSVARASTVRRVSQPTCSVQEKELRIHARWVSTQGQI
jgi:hypothetical protein